MGSPLGPGGRTLPALSVRGLDVLRKSESATMMHDRRGAPHKNEDAVEGADANEGCAMTGTLAGLEEMQMLELR